MLVVTGVYLTFWFDPSLATTTYHGSYAPLDGSQMSVAYRSTVDLSLDTRAGLLVRQTHHWAALVFIVALVLHMLRVFFTGAFRKPRDLNWYLGLTMLTRRARRGVRRLLAAGRPALGHGARDRVLGRDVDPMARRAPRPVGVERRLPRVGRDRAAPVHRCTC